MIENLKSILPKNRFARNASILTGGTVAGQILVVLSSPVLTRLYDKDDFGVLAVYASILTMFSVIASLRYQLAIPLPDDDEEAAGLLIVGLVFVLVMTIFSSAIVFSCRNEISALINTPLLAEYLWLLPPGIFFIGCYQIFYYLAIRENAFSTIARTRFAQAISMVAIQLGGTLFGTLSLILGQVAGHAAGTMSLIAVIGKKYRPKVVKQLRFKNIFYVAKKYKRFPFYSTWGGLLNTIGQQTPSLLFAGFYNASTAGVYLLAHRVIAMPMSLIGRSVANVFISSANEAYKKNELASLVSEIHTKLVSISMPPTLILLIAGPDLFSLVFGESWRGSGEFARWMSILMYSQFVISPLSQIVSILNKELQGTVFQIVLFLVQVGGLLLGTYLNRADMSVMIFALGSAVCYFGFFGWIIKVSGSNWSLLWHPTAKAICANTILIMPIIVYYIVCDDVIWWFIATMLSIILIGNHYYKMMRMAW